MSDKLCQVINSFCDSAETDYTLVADQSKFIFHDLHDVAWREVPGINYWKQDDGMKERGCFVF